MYSSLYFCIWIIFYSFLYQQVIYCLIFIYLTINTILLCLPYHAQFIHFNAHGTVHLLQAPCMGCHWPSGYRGTSPEPRHSCTLCPRIRWRSCMATSWWTRRAEYITSTSLNGPWYMQCNDVSHESMAIYIPVTMPTDNAYSRTRGWYGWHWFSCSRRHQRWAGWSRLFDTSLVLPTLSSMRKFLQAYIHIHLLQDFFVPLIIHAYVV